METMSGGSALRQASASEQEEAVPAVWLRLDSGLCAARPGQHSHKEGRNNMHVQKMFKYMDLFYEFNLIFYIYCYSVVVDLEYTIILNVLFLYWEIAFFNKSLNQVN